MSKYLGNKCIVCEKVFEENDDVVVCPVCGTPYHRECYKIKGDCVNLELHENGGSWKPDKKEPENPPEEEQFRKCQKCGSINKPRSIICESCGMPLSEQLKADLEKTGYTEKNGMDNPYFSFQDKYCGMNPDEKFDSVSLRELSAFVKNNQAYYLPIFKKIRDTGHKISLNIVSFFVPELYFANRKMWFWTVLSILISTLLSLPSVVYLLAEGGMINGTVGPINVDSGTFKMIYSVSGYASYAFKALMLMFANWLYYRHAINKINRFRDSDGNVSRDTLSEAGGTSAGAILISLAAETLVMMIIISSLTFMRAQ